MEAPSFVSKARTAFHSAAAKAERVFTDIKSDFSNNEGKHLRWRPAHIGTKQEWQDRFKNIRIGKKGAENHTEKVENPTTAVPFYDENSCILNVKNDVEAKGSQVSAIVERLYSTNPDTIPPTSVLKQLAIAIDAGKKYKSMKDILASSGGSSPIMERASLSLAAVKSLVLREKEYKLASEFGGDDEKVLSLIRSLFDVEGEFLRRNISSGLEALSLPKDIHGAPPESLLVKLSEVIGSFKTLRKMAFIWCKIVAEMRRLSEELHMPGIPLDNLPDLNSCLLYQKFQVINCCVSRKRRHILATESLELVMRDASLPAEQSSISNGTVSSSHILYARLSNGENVLRLGTDRPADNLTILETGEPVYSPITQEGPLLTEDLIRENEEFVLRTGSVGAGCSQLLSDMQAFKAANPGCILEDFVRWHSPPDWTDILDEANEFSEGGDASSTRGQLSRRMQKEGNLWRELWETAKAVPAIKQAPLFDEDLAAEDILHDLEELSPSELFEQLFISLLGLGFVMAESKLSSNNDLSKLFNECKDYIVFTKQGSSWSEKVDDLCQVYETVEKTTQSRGSPQGVLQGSASDLCTLTVCKSVHYNMESTAEAKYAAFEEKVKRTIFVDNLSPQVTETVLAKALNQFGTVVSASLIPNYLEPRNILCALVEMEDSEKAKKVISSITEFPFLIAGMPRPVRARFAEVEMFDDRPVKPGRRVRCSWLDPSNPDFEVAKKLKRLTRKHAAEAFLAQGCSVSSGPRRDFASFELMAPKEMWSRPFSSDSGDAVDVVVPFMGESITDGTLAKFLKKVDEPIAQIETDKVTIDVASPEAGVIKEVAVVSKSGEGVAHVAPSEKITEKPPPKKESAPQGKKEEKPKVETAPATEKPKAPAPAPPKLSAREPQLPPKERERRVPMTRLRKRVATRLKDSQNTFALLTTFNEVDMTNLMKLRSDYKDAFVEKHGVKLGLMSGFVKAAVSGLQNQPIINAVIDGDDIIYRDYVDVSIAVGTPKGLVVPVIRNADKMNFAEIEKEINTLAKKANDGTISIDEMAGGSFTISNGGVYGSLLSTPIINPPQSAILGMHSIVNRPMVVGGNIVPRPMMYIALTYDHRLIDGREAVFFLRRIKDVVEDPRRLLLDI
ncbi:hypothetical protein GH714_024058 [Hevea brasiliensis]|uniref:dihydrolipoyllysine-residue succinyltransferase n=1 Tax=Hevea brasiliensis TaxID=3981 RepID=A0A6A6MNU8_HEVBR|nr:hypothetical protein GH714_024058 [Hevea brasiliensis]